MCARGHKPRDQSQARSAEHSYLSEDFLWGLLAAEHALRIKKNLRASPLWWGLPSVRGYIWGGLTCGAQR
jgi:hypothetical protein